MAEKICKLAKKGLHKNDPEKFIALAKEGRYLCASCGRTAAQKKTLCKPSNP